MLTKEQILAAEDIPREKVSTPEWGGDGHVWVRGLEGVERDAFEQELVDRQGGVTKSRLKNIRARLCTKCICTEQGARLFEDGDAESLGKKSALVLDRIFDKAQELSGMTPESRKELEGNSEATTKGGSGSD